MKYILMKLLFIFTLGVFLCSCKKEDDVKVDLEVDSEANSNQTRSTSTWLSIANTEFCNLDVWCGSGLYFHEENNVPSCTFMVYGSGVYVASYYTSVVTIDEDGLIKISLPETMSTGVVNAELDPEKSIEIQLVFQKQQIVWGDLVFEIGPYANSYEHIANWDESPASPMPSINPIVEGPIVEGPIHFNDPSLEAIIRKACNKPSGDILTADALAITTLDASSRVQQAFDSFILDTSHIVKDLEGLQYFTNLKVLNLDGNQISDISPLSSLTHLEELRLSCNQITNIAALENLTQLKVLSLAWNSITNADSLQNLMNLKELYLNQSDLLIPIGYTQNSIENINFITNLINLTVLNIEFQNIKELQVLTNLPHLQALYASSNQIKDLEPLKDLINLEILSLNYNLIDNITPLQDLTKLKRLSIGFQNISDIQVLGNFTELTFLDARENPINDPSVIKKLTKLEEVYLDEI